MLFLSGNLSLLPGISHAYLLRRRFWKRLGVSVWFVNSKDAFLVGFKCCFFFFPWALHFRDPIAGTSDELCLSFASTQPLQQQQPPEEAE